MVTQIQNRKKTSLARDTRGLSTVEYAIILCLIAIVGFAVWQSFGKTIESKVSGADTTLGTMPSSATAGGGS